MSGTCRIFPALPEDREPPAGEVEVLELDARELALAEPEQEDQLQRDPVAEAGLGGR